MEASEVAMIVGETVRACLKQFTLSPLLTIDEIAEKLKISKDAVRAYIRSGELKAYELGARLVRVEIAEVNEFLAKMQVRSQDSEPEKDRESARWRNPKSRRRIKGLFNAMQCIRKPESAALWKKDMRENTAAGKRWRHDQSNFRSAGKQQVCDSHFFN